MLAEALSSTEQLIVIDEVSAGLDKQGVAGLTGIIRNSATAGTAFVLADQQSVFCVDCPDPRVPDLGSGHH